MSKKTNINSSDNLLGLYLKDITHIKLLNREDENKLVVLAQAGDVEARNKLVSGNLRFVVSIARRYKSNSMDLVDLISEGNIGLITAISNFDPARGFHFISYSVWWIRQAILKAIYDKSRMVRLPLNKTNELNRVLKTKKDLEKLLGEEPELKDIASALELQEADVVNLLKISQEHISLDTPIGNSNDSLNVGDTIGSDAMQPEECTMKHSLADDIEETLATLSSKEADVLKQRFGINNVKPQSLKEIAHKYDLTKERIRQIEKKAIERLRHPSKSYLLEAYV